MSSGGFRSESLSTEAETTIELLPLVTPKTPPLLICRVELNPAHAGHLIA
jgi:hypothetical protein